MRQRRDADAEALVSTERERERERERGSVCVCASVCDKSTNVIVTRSTPTLCLSLPLHPSPLSFSLSALTQAPSLPSLSLCAQSPVEKSGTRPLWQRTLLSFFVPGSP